MKALRRQAPPAFWIDRVCRFLDLLASGDAGATKDPRKKLHDWSAESKTLAQWFHATVRPAGEGAFCAYCDGLFAQSPETIDHWVPVERCPELALWWGEPVPCLLRLPEGEARPPMVGRVAAARPRRRRGAHHLRPRDR